MWFIMLLNSQEHKLYKLQYISLQEVKIVSFKQWFQSVAIESNLFKLYLKIFRPRSNCKPSKIQLVQVKKSSLFPDLQWPRVQISRQCVQHFIA